jgi:hypothetical protein
MFLRRLLAMASMAAAAWLPSGPCAAADDAMSRDAGDVTVHLGVMPLAAAVEREASNPRDVTHDLMRFGRGTRHVVVALFNTRSHERITDAQVTATVTEVGLNAEEKPLKQMSSGNVISYGNTFTINPGAHYTIKIVVRRPGAHAPVDATFDYSLP